MGIGLKLNYFNGKYEYEYLEDGTITNSREHTISDLQPGLGFAFNMDKLSGGVGFGLISYTYTQPYPVYDEYDKHNGIRVNSNVRYALTDTFTGGFIFIFDNLSEKYTSDDPAVDDEDIETETNIIFGPGIGVKSDAFTFGADLIFILGKNTTPDTTVEDTSELNTMLRIGGSYKINEKLVISTGFQTLKNISRKEEHFDGSNDVTEKYKNSWTQFVLTGLTFGIQYKVADKRGEMSE